LQYMAQKKPPVLGIHPTAEVSHEASIHETASIGPYCVIGVSKIGPGVVIEAHSIIGDRCSLAEKVWLHARVTLYDDVCLGVSTVVHSGTVIGSDGFGFVPKRTGGWEKMPQVGGVRIGDRVDIGANTTIDRGALSHTVIGNDVILDNLIQIAHNVEIGDGTAMAACTAVAGSTKIGRRCMIGGASLISGHIVIVDDVHLAGGTGVSNHIKEKGVYASAITARPFEQWRRNLARFHHLDELGKRVKKIEKQIEESL
jgi:UDP-3-O-[3-hydroxymyristoyl] glucosamine N-acyltransferase